MKKPEKCPRCGSKSIAKILYGEPRYSEELKKKLATGKITLGGCCQVVGGPFMNVMIVTHLFVRMGELKDTKKFKIILF